MNEIAVIYYSAHHSNTKKVLDAMSEERGIDLIPVSEVKDHDLTKYKKIGLASGIYFSELHKMLGEFAKNYDFKSQNAFLVYTSGSGKKGMGRKITDTLNEKQIPYSVFSCRGYDTNGIFKVIGGIAKKHPNQKDFKDAKEFIKNL